MRKNLKLEYGMVSIEYVDVRKYRIKFTYLYIGISRIDLLDVKFIKYGNEIIWKNKRRRR